MGDINEGDIVLVFQFLKQIDNVHFHGCINGRDGLVSYDDFGTSQQCPGNRDPLEFAPGELGGILILHYRKGHAYALQRLVNKSVRFAPTFGNMQPERGIIKIGINLLAG